MLSWLGSALDAREWELQACQRMLPNRADLGDFAVHRIGFNLGYRVGRGRGMDVMADYFHGDKPSTEAVARAARRRKARQARKRHRKATR